jgi:hypothetical protein
MLPGKQWHVVAQLSMLVSALSHLHDLSFLILFGLVVKSALHNLHMQVPTDRSPPVFVMSLHSQVRAILLGTRI